MNHKELVELMAREPSRSLFEDWFIEWTGCDPDRLNCELEWEAFQEGHRTAQAALQAIPDAGWVVVPEEPTGAMLQAGNRPWLDGENEKAIYKAMIAEANKP